MISQNQIKYLKALQQKKNRLQHGQFVVEGEKMVAELISSGYEVVEIYHTKDYLIESKQNPIQSVIISEKDLGRVSSLKTPNHVIAIAKIADNERSKIAFNDISLVLDKIQDPGNLGTIIRTADWFGIKQIYCSLDTVDCYNPKVVQATMGSIFRVEINYVALDDLYKLAQDSEMPILGTSLKGENLYTQDLPQKGLVVMGNESKGIFELTETNLTQAIKIPSYPEEGKIESLNVSIATALICAELRRP